MDSKTIKETHVLMVAFAAQGHINPLLRLGRRLVSRGFRVALATTEVAKTRLLKSIATAATTTDAVSISDIELLFFADGLDLNFDRKANMDYYMDTLGRFGPISLSNLIQNHYQEKNLACVISNPFVPWVVDVAAKHEIPCAMLWIQPCALFSIYYRFYTNLNAFPTLENPVMDVELPGLPILKTLDLPSFVRPENPFGSIPKLFHELFQNIKKHKWVLANSFFELEKETIESMNELCPIRPVGPLVPPSILGQEPHLDIEIGMWESDETCVDWLNKQEKSSVVYVSFGSIIESTAKQMEEIATALKNLKSPFIWVVRKPQISTEDGKGELPLGFLEETKNQGIVVSWSPQTKVLSHESIGCFVTHCGWNSLLETIAAGVPVVACPNWTDQPTNAKLVTDIFRIGLRLNPGNQGLFGHEEIEKCVEQVMFGPKSEEFKKRCAEVKQAARTTLAGGGSSERNIQMLADEIFGSSSDCAV